MTKNELMASASTLAPKVVEPRDFSDDPFGVFWRGVMFGLDANRDLEFTGLKPRFSADLATGDTSIWFVKWGPDYLRQS